MKSEKGFTSFLAAASLTAILLTLGITVGCVPLGATAGHSKACFYDTEGIKADYDGMNGLMRTAKEDPKKPNQHMLYRKEQNKEETARAKIMGFWQRLASSDEE